MSKRQNTVLNMMILVLALCVTFFAFTPVRGYAADTELEWGYGNPSKGVIWVLDNETMTVYLNDDPSLPKDSLVGFPPDLTPPSSDEEKAVTQLFNNKGTGKENSYRKVSSDNKLQFTNEGTALKNKVEKIVIRDGITGIGWKAKWDNNSYVPPYDGEYAVDKLNTGVFQDFNKLTSVETCSSIKRIGWSAFRRCSSLNTFDFGSMVNLEEIMNQAFSPCDELTEIDLSKCTKLTTIRQNAFHESKKISGVILPDGLKTVGKTAFKGCNSLEYVKFGDTSKVELIGAQAFQGAGAKPESRSKLAYVTDEKTKRKAVVIRATPKLFNDNVLQTTSENPDRPDEVFWYGALEEYFWDLDVTVNDKEVAYNGAEQYGYEVKDVTGTGSDPVETDGCKVKGLHKDHVLTMTSDESGTGYKPSQGTELGTYDNGEFKNDPGIKAMYEGYDYGINYELGTHVPGKLKIQPAVVFVDYNGREISRTGYDPGTKAEDIVRPTDPTRASDAQYDYEFDGWEPDIVDVTGNATYTATYKATVREYSVKFVNDDGTVLQDTKEKYGSTPSYKGSTPTKPETDKYTYTFKGWKPDISKVTGDATYKAEFTAVAKPQPVPAPVDDDDDDNGGGRRSGNGRRGGNAITPAEGGTVAPDAPADADINDDPVPAADTPEEPEDIDDPDVPLVDNVGWALINLLCMLATAALFVVMLVRSIRKRQEDERAGIIYVIIGLAVAVFAALIFFMTEDMKLPMIMTDRWTILMACILAVQLAVALLFRVRTADEDEEE